MKIWRYIGRSSSVKSLPNSWFAVATPKRILRYMFIKRCLFETQNTKSSWYCVHMFANPQTLPHISGVLVHFFLSDPVSHLIWTSLLPPCTPRGSGNSKMGRTLDSRAQCQPVFSFSSLEVVFHVRDKKRPEIEGELGMFQDFVSTTFVLSFTARRLKSFWVLWHLKPAAGSYRWRCGGS